MALTYEKIATTTLSSIASSINFTSISSSYTDLKWVLNGTIENVADVYIRYNSNNSSIYSWTRMGGINATPQSTATSNSDNQRISFSNPSTYEPFYITGDIFNYAGSSFKSTLIQYYGNHSTVGAQAAGVYAGTWRGTVPITELNIRCDANFNAGTTATLYGILKA